MLNIIILAAGASSRMNSKIPKILHKIGNFPIIHHVIHNAVSLKPDHIVVVIDRSCHYEVEKILKTYNNLSFSLVYQDQKLGTGDAANLALCSMSYLTENDVTIILYGDTPLITNKTVSSMISNLHSTDNSIILLSFRSSDQQYGRIITDKYGRVMKITEAKDYPKSSDCCNNIDFLANSGAIAGYSSLIKSYLEKLEQNDNTQEYYMTDIVDIANRKKMQVSHVTVDEREAIGINNRFDLQKAELHFQNKKRNELLGSGVTLLSPENTFFSFDTQIAYDVVVHPYVFFGLKVKIESNSEIFSYSHLEDCLIKTSSLIGPFVRVRGKTVVEEGSQIGNFVEIKESHIGPCNKIKHLSYIGNTSLGKNNNIGAGTVICNYDGRQKHCTEIGNNCFIGANSTLIAPISVEDNVTVAAGSTIVDNVPKSSLAISREKQVIKTSYYQKNKNIKEN